MNNKELLDKRKEDIQTYLKYVIQHKHLKKNTAFRIFLTSV